MSLQNRSSFEAVKGQDALLAYQPIAYQPNTYVERNGLIFKSLSATSTTFIPQQWELIADLREVRVPNIASRNALTGMTATTGTTGIRIPILDNTNVLVLDAFSDPQVGVHEFARYNYNQSTAKWLLLQKGTGTTSTNVSNYQLLTNKPPVISGVTVNAGSGLVGGGSIFGINTSPFSAGGVIPIAHADTSAQPSLNGSGYAYVQKLNLDTFGHVTGATLSTWIHPSGLTHNYTNTGYTYIQSIQINNGHLIGVGTSTWVHPATSFQGSSNNAGNVFIQSIQLDSNGHVVGISTGTAAGGGGGGSPLRYNGDFGGALTMSSGGTLTISGGTAIKTTRTGGAINAGLRIDVVTGVGANQIFYSNGSSGFLGSPSLVYSAGTNTLSTVNLVLSGIPSSGATTDQFLTRNPATGAVQRLGISTILSPLIATNGLTRIGNNIKLGGTLTGHTTIGGGSFDLFFTNRSITQNTRSGAVGSGSASFGDGHVVSGLFAFAEGNINVASGSIAHAEGIKTVASGSFSHSQGNTTIASGFYSHAGGNGLSTGGRELLASGTAAFNHSQNDSNQTGGDGALADNSAILGGLNNSIAAGNQRAAIIGGQLIKLTGSTYVDTVAVGNLAIFITPAVGGSDDILTWNSSNKKIRKITKASLLGAPVNSIQFNSGNTVFGGDAQWIFDSINKAVTLGTRSAGVVGVNSMSVGTSHIVSGTSAFAVGQSNRASGVNSFAGGFNAINFGSASLAYGQNVTIQPTSNYSVALGINATADGQNNSAFAIGIGVKAIGAGSIAIGHGGTGVEIYAKNGGINISNNSNSPSPSRPGVGASGSWSAILGGNNHSIDISSFGAAIIGGHGSISGFPGINLSGASYVDTVAVSKFAIFSTPPGGGNDDLLSWNAATKTIGKVAQSTFNLTANNGLTKSGTNIHLGGSLTGNTVISSGFNINISQGSILIGGTTGTTGQQSLSVGTNNTTVLNSVAFGITARATGSGSLAGGSNLSVAGRSILASGIGSFNYSVGAITPGFGANGQASAILGGSNNNVNSISSVVFGGVFNSITSNGSTSTAILVGQSNTINNTVGSPSFSAIIAGQGGTIDGTTSGSVIIGGQNGTLTGNTSNSVIIGGLNNRIRNNVGRAVIIGGQNITLTGSSQSDFVVVPGFMIWNTPGAGGSDDVLTWNATTKKVNKVTQASISDERLKKDLIPLTNVVSKIANLSSVEFKYNEINTPNLVNKLDYGLIAQEVEKVFPYVVSDNIRIDDIVYKTVDYKKLVPVLFAAIKELNDKITELERKLN